MVRALLVRARMERWFFAPLVLFALSACVGQTGGVSHDDDLPRLGKADGPDQRLAFCDPERHHDIERLLGPFVATQVGDETSGQDEVDALTAMYRGFEDAGLIPKGDAERLVWQTAWGHGGVETVAGSLTIHLEEHLTLELPYVAEATEDGYSASVDLTQLHYVRTEPDPDRSWIDREVETILCPSPRPLCRTENLEAVVAHVRDWVAAEDVPHGLDDHPAKRALYQELHAAGVMEHYEYLRTLVIVHDHTLASGRVVQVGLYTAGPDYSTVVDYWPDTDEARVSFSDSLTTAARFAQHGGFLAGRCGWEM